MVNVRVRRTVEELSILSETRTVTGTVPRTLIRIPLERTAEVRAPGACEREKI